ncbi:MAG TPA: hypothetical protein VMZ03_03925 [Chitinophagaceae bacterium]|nr:hypothetical protein [Chitinophagaceae bacterium]
MKEFRDLVLGNVSIAYYLAAEFFALLALILSLNISAKKRDVNSSTTPVQYSFLFMVWDNTKRIVMGQIVLFLIFRFTTEFLQRQLTMWMAVGIGFLLSFGIDRAIAMIRAKFDFLDMNREKLINKISNTGTGTGTNGQ